MANILSDINQALCLLREKGSVAILTETVYGLTGNAGSKKALYDIS